MQPNEYHNLQRLRPRSDVSYDLTSRRRKKVRLILQHESLSTNSTSLPYRSPTSSDRILDHEMIVPLTNTELVGSIMPLNNTTLECTKSVPLKNTDLAGSEMPLNNTTLEYTEPLTAARENFSVHYSFSQHFVPKEKVVGIQTRLQIALRRDARLRRENKKLEDLIKEKNKIIHQWQNKCYRREKILQKKDIKESDHKQMLRKS